MSDTSSPAPVVLGLREVDRTHLALVGGKGANLGELTRIDGVHVPDGFCVTTEAYARSVEASIGDLLVHLSSVTPNDRDAVRALSAEIRGVVESTPIPSAIWAEISEALEMLGSHRPVAVRSSATAEDLAFASFAGQHDSFLNVVGAPAVLEHVRRCWASLFTERAVVYRARNGIDHRGVRMSVVVQEMVDADAAGVVFTADPTTSNRTITTIEAAFGLGEDLVSGRVDADVSRVRHDEIVDRTISGTRPVLTDTQALELARLARRIEDRFGAPQDIEWCLADGRFLVVQSRPITTLFPVPDVDDDAPHVYISVGHQQMMTDAMKPLGLSFWLMTTRAPMVHAAGRLFVDVTTHLASPAGRGPFLDMVGRSDPLIRDALETVAAREGFLPPPPDGAGAAPPPGTVVDDSDVDPSLVNTLVEETRASLERARLGIRDLSGPQLFDFITDDLVELRRLLFDPRSHRAIMAGIGATWWLHDHIAEWLGDPDAADVLTRSAPGNVTSEMGLALLDVADTIRPHREVVAFLERVDGDDFLDRLDHLEGGPASRAAIEGYLDRYGMRCVGEIDITRPRWSERPSALLPTILSHVHSLEPGEARRRREQGLREAASAERDILERLQALPDGERLADETGRVIRRLRDFIGYREYPKYGMVSRYFLYKEALLGEAERLVEAGVLRHRDDVFFLHFDEFRDLARTRLVDQNLIERRRAAQRSYEALTPPRVLTSEGDALDGAYRRLDIPPGALVGLAVSSGTIEGRARVVTDMEDADLEQGDILVTTHTDPSWSPLFVTAAGLVTEVGGLMTHGAVIAREYGLPAVVGVADATRSIQDGQRIRVDGTNGTVEIVPPE